ncbi:hypothetical protein JCM9279_006799 [Rhodotorula babjevae]
MNALGPCGLAKLPEELADLVCTFIVSFPDVKDLVTTLGSLALTSRQFLEPARRAFLHDPTCILAIRTTVDAHTLLDRINQQPALGERVKRLDGFRDMFDAVEGLSLAYEHPHAFMNWAVSLVRLCPNATAVSVWPDPAAGWLAALALLPRLRHVSVGARGDEEWCENDFEACHGFVKSLPLMRLDSLQLQNYYGPQEHALVEALKVPVSHLELAGYESECIEIGLDLSTVRHLVLRPWPFDLHLETVLPPALETFALRPDFRFLVGAQQRELCQWIHLFRGPRPLEHLHTVVLEGVAVDIRCFALVAKSAPQLRRLELRNATWLSASMDTKLDGLLVDVLAGLPRLRFLHLGQLPDPPCSILDTRVYCRIFNIELEWRGVELEQVKVSSPSPAAPRSEVSEGGPERTAAEEEPMSDGGGGGLDGWGGDTSSVEAAYEVWRLMRAAALGFDLDPSSSAASSPSSSRTYPPTPSLDSAAPISDTLSHASLPPRLSPSPTPTLDDGTLTGVVFARTAAAEQRYLAEPASQPHLEDGYQATDDGVDEGLDEDEPWEGWADECDVSEADLEWRECDDEGEDECVGRLWLVEGEWDGALGEDEVSTEEL